MFRTFLSKIFENKKGYSLLEIVVSLAIIAIMMVMLTNILVISLTISAKTTARSNVREEVSNTLANMKRDIRNAEIIKGCSGENEDALCNGVLSVSGEFIWEMCVNEDDTKSVCKVDKSGNVLEKTADYLNIDKLIFDVGFDKTPDKRTVIVTIIASYKNPKLNVKNIVQQTSISTRNYQNL